MALFFNCHLSIVIYLSCNYDSYTLRLRQLKGTTTAVVRIKKGGCAYFDTPSTFVLLILS